MEKKPLNSLLLFVCACLPVSVSAGALSSHRAPSGARVSIEHSPSAREVKRSYPLSHPPSPPAFELFQTLYVAAGINCRLFLTYPAAHALSLFLRFSVSIWWHRIVFLRFPWSLKMLASSVSNRWRCLGISKGRTRLLSCARYKVSRSGVIICDLYKIRTFLSAAGEPEEEDISCLQSFPCVYLFPWKASGNSVTREDPPECISTHLRSFFPF